jgi:hypothetical protein
MLMLELRECRETIDEHEAKLDHAAARERELLTECNSLKATMETDHEAYRDEIAMALGKYEQALQQLEAEKAKTAKLTTEIEVCLP